MELKGKNALITGSGIRLGRAIALALAAEGCNLALHYHHSEEEVREVQIEADEAGVRAEIFQADLSNPEQLQQMMHAVAAAFGHIDILINNAGIYPKGKGMDTTSELLEQVFNVNLFAPLLLTRAFAQQLPEGFPGKVINISDAKVFRHQPDHFAYRLTKNGINEMTALFALELAPHITVNAIAPGIMLPLAGNEDADLQDLAERRIPLKRIGSPEIIAENVLHILHQDFMTGTVIRIDGGEWA
ncbi:MAG TPA: glucose dehydrogenase [Anaerolineaceae bacterium]|nr:MAG: Glucose dehydrogenase [Anaerolineae bacterium 49_20]HAE85304.1 glucose dehydrogenase [Anaerolineaceae bacterium]